MNYHGKNYLYDFLKEHGYDVPKRKEMQYSFFRGSEWLKSDLLEAWSPIRNVIFVSVKEYRVGQMKKEIEWSRYTNGICVFKKLNGSYVIGIENL